MEIRLAYSRSVATVHSPVHVVRWVYRRIQPCPSGTHWCVYTSLRRIPSQEERHLPIKFFFSPEFRVTQYQRRHHRVFLRSVPRMPRTKHLSTPFCQGENRNHALHAHMPHELLRLQQGQARQIKLGFPALRPPPGIAHLEEVGACVADAAHDLLTFERLG